MIKLFRQHKGQAALILILVSALALIFYALTLNWGRNAQIKTLTMAASTTAAAQMASGYSSYGESVLQQQLGGVWKICKSNGILGALLALLVVVIVVLLVVCQVCGVAAIMGAMSTAAIIAVVAMSVINLALQVLVVQPGLTRLWNSMQKSKNLPFAEQVLLQGMQTGLQQSITDTAHITDYFDANTNGRYGYGPSGPNDTLSRYGFFYTERLKAIEEPDQVDLQPFIDGLNALSPQTTVPCTDVNDPHCNPCCIPADINGRNLRPDTCPTEDIPAECTNVTVWPHAGSYPLVNDTTYPDYATGTSFLAKFGVDAEVRPFDGTDAKGLFSMLWQMDTLRSDPNVLPNAMSVTDPTLLDTRFSDQVSQMSSFQAADDQCADVLDPATGLWWKKGADQYCSSAWPYSDCLKHNSLCDGTATAGTASTCGCTSATAAAGDWPEDALDDLVYGLKEFNGWAAQFTQQDEKQLISTMDVWYPDAAKWVGPACNGTNERICFDGGYVGNSGGFLYSYSQRLGYWIPMLENWLNATTYAADNAWCIPSAPTGIGPEELAAINSGGAWGSLGSVISCLSYNSTNDQRFKLCRDEVTDINFCPNGGVLDPLSACHTLPRSLAGAPPVFDPCVPGSAYVTWLSDSMTLAAPQSAKFQQRYQYLENMRTKTEEALAAMKLYKTQLDGFLNGPALQALFKAREDYESLYLPELPNFMIYGWRDQSPPKSGSRNVGYWHLARVEGQVPMRCSTGQCIARRLPWVRTYTTGFLGMTRCYELSAYTGRVLTRVTRWDEDHDPLTFANKTPLWRFRMTAGGNTAGLKTIDEECVGLGANWKSIGITNDTLDQLELVWGAETKNFTEEALRGAFMINAKPKPGSKEEKCWKLVNELLKYGPSTQVCAKYTLGQGKKHMDVRFEQCPMEFNQNGTQE